MGQDRKKTFAMALRIPVYATFVLTTVRLLDCTEDK